MLAKMYVMEEVRAFWQGEQMKEINTHTHTHTEVLCETYQVCTSQDSLNTNYVAVFELSHNCRLLQELDLLIVAGFLTDCLHCHLFPHHLVRASSLRVRPHPSVHRAKGPTSKNLTQPGDREAILKGLVGCKLHSTGVSHPIKLCMRAWWHATTWPQN